MDLTAKLADELWCHVFDYVSSLSHKFKLAAVNGRFRRCVMTNLGKPMLLELDFRKTTSCGRLNGCGVRLDKYPVALQVLSEKTQFVSINIVGDRVFGIRDEGQFLEKILTILMEEDCLSEVTSLKTQSLFNCDRIVWCSFLAQCAKLQVLDLGCAFMCSSNLGAALENKPLTELSLKLIWYDQRMLDQLLKSPVRHKLRKMHLSPDRSFGVWDLPRLVRELGESAWSHLEEIFIDWMPRMGQLVHKEQLFDALVSSLPRLSRCHIRAPLGYHLIQFVPAIRLVLNARNRGTKLAMVYKSYFGYNGSSRLSGCRAVPMIRQLQRHHPELEFDFDQDLGLSFQLGNVSLCLQMGGYGTCQDVNCINCHSFYPIVLDQIGEAALWDTTTGRVENYRLDRCRVNRVAADIKNWVATGDLKNWQSQRIEVTEVNQGHNLVAFTALSKAGDPFNIAIASGPCFFNPCLACLNID